MDIKPFEIAKERGDLEEARSLLNDMRLGIMKQLTKAIENKFAETDK